MLIDIKTASRDQIVNAFLVLEEERKTFSELLLEKENRISGLEIQIEWFKRQLFGQKSEKLIPQDPHQRTLFDVPEVPPSETTSVKTYERSTRKKPTFVDEEKTIRFDPSVPVDEEVILPKEVEDLPTESYEIIGEKITDRLVQIPVQYRVKRTIRKTVKIKETKNLHTAPAPAAVIDRSFADSTFLAGLITDKFQYHLPLYRQHQRMDASGVHVARGHLTKLVHRTLELLEPIYYSILSSITTSEVVSMDETPIKAGLKENGKMDIAYFWPVFAENQVAFIYSSSRSHSVIAKNIGTGCKKLLSDGHSAYETYVKSRQDIIHAQCWAHARRKFFEAKDYSPPECNKILEDIKMLFEIESDIKDKPPESILRARREKSFPVVDQIFTYLHYLWFERMVDKTSPLGKAISYSRDRKDGLMHFLDHPDIPISNNHVERAIRPVAVGRKNWLFCWTEVGAKYSAIAYTLVESCKLQGINPWVYINDVLIRLDSHPARDVHLLTPKFWKIKTQ